jgi:hypothetical protein
MRRLIFALALLTGAPLAERAALSTLALPRAFRIRIRLDASHATSADSARVVTALTRGLYADTTAFPTHRWPGDTLIPGRIPGSAVLMGSVIADGTSIAVRLRVYNILAQVVAGPDSVRVAREQVDSTLAEMGRRYAQRLTPRAR